MLEIDENFKPVRLQAVDGLPRHKQIFVGRRLQRPLHIEQARLDDHHCGGNAALVAEDEFHIGPFFHLGAAAARAAEERQPHCSGVDGVERGGQV